MKKQILMLITVCVVVVSSFVSCGGGEGENWTYFTSYGRYSGSITRFQHSWNNRTPVTLEVQYLNSSTYISPGRTVTVIISGGNNSSLRCKVHAEDNRELKIEDGGFEVRFYDK